MHLFQSVYLYLCDKAFIDIMSSFAVQVIDRTLITNLLCGIHTCTICVIVIILCHGT